MKTNESHFEHGFSRLNLGTHSCGMTWAWVALLAAGVFVLSTFSCKPRNELNQDSDVKYGFLSKDRRRLVKVPDGGTIRICGDDTKNIRWAIATWGAVLGRTYNIVETCSGADIQSFGASDPNAVADCKKENIDVGGGFARPWTNPMQIVNCGAWNSGTKFILHETGHLFGMCDQYQASLKNCVYKTAIDPTSVMAVADKEYLTEDDKAGVRALNTEVGGAPLGNGGNNGGVMPPAGDGGGGAEISFRDFIGKRYRDANDRTLWLNPNRACTAKRGGSIQPCGWSYDNGYISVTFKDNTVWRYRSDNPQSVCFIASGEGPCLGVLSAYIP